MTELCLVCGAGMPILRSIVGPGAGKLTGCASMEAVAVRCGNTLMR
jgi:hypothetical protein